MVDERRAESFSRRAPPKTTSYILHENCGGIVFFLVDPNSLSENRRRLIPPGDIQQMQDERRCLKCQRHELYERNVFIVIGKPGVPEKELQNLCDAIRANSEILEILRDKFNPSVTALKVYLPLSDIFPNNWPWIDFEAWVKEQTGEENFEKYVLAICRNPAVDEPPKETPDPSRKRKRGA